MLFSLKLQRDNRKNTLAVDPAKGKTGKKLYFSPHCGDETNTYLQSLLKSPIIAVCWCDVTVVESVLGFSGGLVGEPHGKKFGCAVGSGWCLISWNSKGISKKIGCVIENGWCLFPWSSKGITNKMPQPWSPPRGKLEKKSVFSPYCGDKADICHDRAKTFLSGYLGIIWNGCVLENGWCFFP